MSIGLTAAVDSEFPFLMVLGETGVRQPGETK